MMAAACANSRCWIWHSAAFLKHFALFAAAIARKAGCAANTNQSAACEYFLPP